MIFALTFLAALSTNPCTVTVEEPTTFTTDGELLLDPSGSDVIGCLLADDPTDIEIVASVDTLVFDADSVSVLLAGETMAIPHEGEFGFAVPLHPIDDAYMCCTLVCLPYVGCTMVCWQGGSACGAPKIITVKTPPCVWPECGW